ncbi:hypothetical protein AAHH80_34040, partial [Burkholderia pseudomallei]
MCVLLVLGVGLVAGMGVLVLVFFDLVLVEEWCVFVSGVVVVLHKFVNVCERYRGVDFRRIVGQVMVVVRENGARLFELVVLSVR